MGLPGPTLPVAQPAGSSWPSWCPYSIYLYLNKFKKIYHLQKDFQSCPHFCQFHGSRITSLFHPSTWKVYIIKFFWPKAFLSTYIIFSTLKFLCCETFWGAFCCMRNCNQSTLFSLLIPYPFSGVSKMVKKHEELWRALGTHVVIPLFTLQSFKMDKVGSWCIYITLNF